MELFLLIPLLLQILVTMLGSYRFYRNKSSKILGVLSIILAFMSFLIMLITFHYVSAGIWLVTMGLSCNNSFRYELNR